MRCVIVAIFVGPETQPPSTIAYTIHTDNYTNGEFLIFKISVIEVVYYLLSSFLTYLLTLLKATIF